MLELINISKTYRSKKAGNVAALKGINLKFGGSGMTFLLGKSGCGKSTLLNVIGGLDFYDEGGEILVDGVSTKAFKSADYDDYRNRYVGFVFQEFNLLENMTVAENVTFGLELQGARKNKEKWLAALAEVGLDAEIADRKATQLSGGQKQRVAIARALIKKPKLILADEPTGDLDSQTGEQIFTLLKDLSKEIPVIVVTHDREAAEAYGDRIIEISDGKIVSDSGEVFSGEITKNDAENATVEA